MRLLASVILFATLAGCGGSDTPQPFRKHWTVMVYMAGDNDLEPFALEDVNEMERVGSDAALNIVVQLDRIPGFAENWTETRRFLVLKDDDPNGIRSPVLENLGEVDMADPAALREFVAWSVARFPAERYALVLWNHGSGWRREPGRGVLFDDTSGTFMTMPELDAGLDVPGVRLDLIAFDASLMGMLEVAYEIRGRAGFIAASEESPPAAGYPYDAILGRLAAHPGAGAEDLGRIIVAEHVRAYPQVPVTQSLIRTDRLEPLARRVSDLGAALLGILPGGRAQVEQARAATQRYAFPYYRDLFDFARNALDLIPDPRVQRAAVEVLLGVPGASGGPVVAEAHSPAPAVARSHGLSIYLPAAQQLFAGYEELELARDFPAWLELARALGGSPVDVTPTPGAAARAPRSRLAGHLPLPH